MHEDDQARIAEAIATANRNQTKEYSYQFRAKTKNGNYIWIEDKIDAQYDNAGNRIRSIIHSRNITERKQAEQIILEQTENLKKLNDDKDRFIAILGHDLRNPFNIILGFLKLLIQNIRKYEIDKIERQINIIYNSAENTYQLLEDILLWAKSQSGKLTFNPQAVKLQDIYDAVSECQKPAAKSKNITVSYFSDKDTKVFADKNMLNTVLRNLISNAIKYTNYGGNIKIYAISKQDYVTLTVSDTGVGMSSETLTRLFDITRINTTPGTAGEKGTGLGLILCKEFMEKHGGTIRAESEAGKGSSFIITLPSFIPKWS